MYREPPREDPSQNHTEEGSSSVSLEHPAEQPPAVPDEYTAPASDGGAPRPPRNNSLRQALSRAAERRTARRLARETRLEQRRTARREKRIARARERARIRDEKARKRAERARKRAELRLMRIHPHQGRAPKRSDAVDQYGNFAGSIRKGIWTSRDGTPNGTFVKEEEGVFLRLDGRRVGYLDQHRDVRTLSHEYVASLRFKVFSVPFTFLWFAVIFIFVISVAIGFRFFVDCGCLFGLFLRRSLLRGFRLFRLGRFSCSLFCLPAILRGLGLLIIFHDISSFPDIHFISPDRPLSTLR